MIDFVVIGNTAFDVNTFLNRNNLDKVTVTNNGGACLYSLIPASIYTKVGVVTRIGNDFNKSLFDNLNIDQLGLKVIDGLTTRFLHTYLSSDGQERSFTPIVNDECMIKVSDIPKEYLSVKHIHVATNFPNIQLEIIKYLKEHSSATISVDTHEAYYNDPTVKEIFDLADIAFIDKEFKKLYDCQAKVKIFKLGAKGCKYVSNEKEFIITAPICNSVIDKTGAGDVVTGVFMTLKSLNYSDEEALQEAVNMATKSIKDYGVEHLLIGDKT